ncbi:MAG: hypothetical protein ACOY3P_15400 [Planctomycetota bacterium]
MDTKRFYETCRHESGHCVVAHALGCRPIQVIAATTGGLCRWERHGPAAPVEQMVLAVAGPIAASMFAHWTPPADCRPGPALMAADDASDHAETMCDRDCVELAICRLQSSPDTEREAADFADRMVTKILLGRMHQVRLVADLAFQFGELDAELLAKCFE